MLSYLVGTIHELFDHGIILLVNGVGYEVISSPSFLQSMETGGEVSMYIHHHIREDQQTLYGFESLAERDLFRQFLSVNGIGPKSALAALSAAPRKELIRAIQLEDHSVFQAVSGIGPKTAKRLVLELKSKVDWEDAVVIPGETTIPTSVRHDVLQALEQLGYQPRIVQTVIADMDVEEMKLEEAIKLVLQRLQ